jgi:hypothetical protein
MTKSNPAKTLHSPFHPSSGTVWRFLTSRVQSASALTSMFRGEAFVTARYLLAFAASWLSVGTAGCGCSETGMEGRTDAAADGPADVSSEIIADALPYGAGSTCSIIEQSGCPAGTWCSWEYDEHTCNLFERCFSRPPGTLEIWESCEGSGPLCQPRVRSAGKPASSMGHTCGAVTSGVAQTRTAAGRTRSASGHRSASGDTAHARGNPSSSPTGSATTRNRQ